MIICAHCGESVDWQNAVRCFDCDGDTCGGCEERDMWSECPALVGAGEEEW